MSTGASTPSSPRGSADPEYAANLRRATLASSVGSALEYYDFALYGLASALIFGELFFPALGTNAGLAAGFATFAVGFLARPFGGLLFGTLGDKLGRKGVLIATIGLMGVSTTLIGVLPTGDQIGIWAPILLVVLRVLQGLGAGAEQAGATVLMAEYAPVRRRGYFSALPFVGIMIGTIIASVVFFLLGLVDTQIVHDWLWRVPFLASILLIAVAIFIRLRLRESPAFINLEKSEQIAHNPLREAFAHSWRTLLRGIGLRMAENGGSAIYQTLAVSYITQVVAVDEWQGPLAIAIGAIIGIFVIPVAGALSDRFGRMRVYRIGSVIQLVLAFPAWWLMSTGSVWLIIPVLAITYGLGVNVMLGAQCAALPELFGNRHRYIGVAITREFSAVIAGGIAPLIGAGLLAAFSDSWVPLAGYVVLLSALTLWATIVTPETRARDLDLASDAIDDSNEDVSSRPLPTVSRREFKRNGGRG
ncbi:MFS transporter [Paramicrobacterium agarici]|uniref:MHS family metabolite:H+ symporter-like MFS transporter n=1 Tax=Paramicrobacterium agarici TaxID=630514 RepID=A0A2A9E0R7_9MICO|nr:MFS transporter [Microbacterium agarici]PFG31812.1 MHS family metabolite:H+ symporter-like MFS transporter [Microbacterium agarici]TQO21709.1 MHS family metabolite:H+ symporter-like MFS transporter [Microbacterium agarici]